MSVCQESMAECWHDCHINLQGSLYSTTSLSL